MLVFTKYCDLPPKVRSFVKKNDDDTYTVVINSRLSLYMQENAYMHEIRHILNNDSSDPYDADTIESNSHND